MLNRHITLTARLTPRLLNGPHIMLMPIDEVKDNRKAHHPNENGRSIIHILRRDGQIARERKKDDKERAEHQREHITDHANHAGHLPRPKFNGICVVEAADEK
jgi:hypothetical protein